MWFLIDINLFYIFFNSPNNSRLTDFERSLEVINMFSKRDLISLCITSIDLEKLCQYFNFPKSAREDLNAMLGVIEINDHHIEKSKDFLWPDKEAALLYAVAMLEDIPILLTNRPESFHIAQPSPRVFSPSQFLCLHNVSQLLNLLPRPTRKKIEYFKLIEDWIEQEKNKAACTVSVSVAMEVRNNYQFATTLLDQINLLLPSGRPIVWLLEWFMDAKEQDQITGSELFKHFSAYCSENNKTVFLIGNDSHQIEEVRTKYLNKYFPELEVSGDFSSIVTNSDQSLSNSEAIIDAINNSKANVVFVSLNTPLQEQVIALHDRLDKAVIIGVGNGFDVCRGHLKEASKYFQRMGLQWLFFLLQDPKKFWSQYIKSIPGFICLISNKPQNFSPQMIHLLYHLGYPGLISP